MREGLLSLGLLFLLFFLPACDSEVRGVVYDWSVLQDGPLPDLKYRYAGSAVEEDGKRHLFYCANIDRFDRFLVTDHIVMRTAVRGQESGEWEYGADEQVALFPGEVSASGEVPWDFEHICDPEVVAGTFWVQRPGQTEAEEYRYALFYLGIRGVPDYLDGIPDGNVNEIGWAVAKDLEGPWHKVGTEPLIPSDAAGYWGVGQPSATSLDEKGEVLLFYTRGEASGTRMVRQRVSLLDANQPVLHGELDLPTDGFLLSDGTPDTLNHGGAVAYDEATDRFYMIRDAHPHPSECPSFIANRLEVAFLPAEDVWDGDRSRGRW